MIVQRGMRERERERATEQGTGNASYFSFSTPFLPGASVAVSHSSHPVRNSTCGNRKLSFHSTHEAIYPASAAVEICLRGPAGATSAHKSFTDCHILLSLERFRHVEYVGTGNAAVAIWGIQTVKTTQDKFLVHHFFHEFFTDRSLICLMMKRILRILS